ncbi:MAG: hypothetical protein IJC71_01810 [Clostridia bacterium]|nr:hypothetical protein [Clostridia bacterium]
MTVNGVEEEKKNVAGAAEVLAFYTSVMRGEEEDASFANRISAADKLLSRHDGDDPVQKALERLDTLLAELRHALADGTFVLQDGEAADDIGEEDAGWEEAADTEDEEDAADGEDEEEEWDEDQ